MAPKKVVILLRSYQIKMSRGSNGNRTSVQIQRPHIIDGRLANLTTEDEELGTDQRHGMVAATAGSKTIDHDAGPLV